MTDGTPDNTRRFPAVELPYRDATLAPYIVRPVFFVVTMLLVVSALGQLGGRILFANLERLEPHINAALADRGVVLHDISGGWRFFNPVLRIGSGEAPGVQFGGAWAELDTLESLARNRIVLRNAEISNLRLTLSQNEAGAWSLEGRVPTEITFDWRSLVWHSDQLRLQASVLLRGHELPSSELTLGASLTNFGGRHRGDVRLASAEACAALAPANAGQCALHGLYNVEESALWFRQRSGGALLGATDLRLRDSAAALLGLDVLELGKLDARMRLVGERYSGPVRLFDSNLQLRGGKPVSISLLADGWSLDDGSQAMLALSALQLGALGEDPDGPANVGNVLELRDARVNWSTGSGAVLQVPEIRVDDVTGVVAHMLSPEVPTSMWIERLGMTGRFTRLLASWSSAAGLGFGGDFDQVAMRSFRGVPKVVGLEGSFTGGPGYLQLRMLDSPATVGLPELYRQDREYRSISGQLLMYFGQDYFGLNADNLRFIDPSMTTTGSFSLVSTKPLSNNHITLALASDAGQFSDLAPYVPYKLPQNVLDWLAESGLQARLQAPRFVMHGPLREEESLMQRSYLIDAEMHDGAMVFNPEWPRITKAEGRVKVSHTSINARLDSAELAGLALEDMTIRLPAGSTSVAAKGTATFDAAAGLNFIRTTPLRSSMDFVADDWWAKGKMQLSVDLDLPLDERMTGELDPRVKLEIAGQLQNTTFGLPEAGLTFTSLRGPINYSYPYALAGKKITGRLFGRPMSLDLGSYPVAAAPSGKPERFAPRRIDFSMAGSMHSDDMWPLLKMEPSDLVDGLFEFAAVYSTETDTGALPVLVARTAFAGAEVNLPDPLGKTATENAPTEATVTFGDALTRASLVYRGLLNAELGIGDDGILGGHLHLIRSNRPSQTSIPRPLARWNGEAGPVLIDGDLDFADIAQWSDTGSGEEDAGPDLPPYRIVDLQITRALLGDFVIPDVRVSGESDAALLRLDFESETATGELRVPTEGTTELVLKQFVYVDPDSAGDAVSASATPTADVAADSGAQQQASEPVVDPLSPELMASLQDMKVRIESLSVDGEDYGSWKFDIRRFPEGIAFDGLVAELKGMNVEAPDGVRWSRADNRTAFTGSISALDMGDVLEGWGYARSIETESMLTQASVSWPGSPLNFELLQLRGDIEAGVTSGRFLDVTSGGNTLRIFSLLNFTAIAKRMSLNFKDVFGRGLSFEKVEAATVLDEGQLRFTRPMQVEGTGGDFKVNGSIDLIAGTLDNEMVVTLPVNKSLPWLGAYLALANPMVGIGVLVGERILRKPIKELSSAKYKITGSLDDPQIELESIFDRSMDEGKSVEQAKEIVVPDNLPQLDELPEEIYLDSLEESEGA